MAEALVLCRHCGAPIAATAAGGWRHDTGLAGCVHGDGFLTTVACPGSDWRSTALGRDDVLLVSYLDRHNVRDEIR